MDVNEIKAKVHANYYAYSQHAELERRVDDLTFAQIHEAFLNGQILEQYPGIGRAKAVWWGSYPSMSSVAGVGIKWLSSLSTFSAPQSSAILRAEERRPMRKVLGSMCGSDRYEERRIEYLLQP
jgi:hypothetical protein